MKSYSSRFTSELTSRAWRICRMLAELHGVPMMSVSWKECFTRARTAIIQANLKAEYEAEQAAIDARVRDASAAYRRLMTERPDCSFAITAREANRRVFG